MRYLTSCASPLIPVSKQPPKLLRVHRNRSALNVSPQTNSLNPSSVLDGGSKSRGGDPLELAHASRRPLMSHDDACFWRATLERRGEPVDVGACERGKARNLLNDFLSESDTVRLQKGGVKWSWFKKEESSGVGSKRRSQVELVQKGGVKWSWLECYRRCVVGRNSQSLGFRV